MRKKSEITVKAAALQVWNESADVVHQVVFFLNVRRVCFRPALPDATISRKLRELRQEGTLNYKVINHELSIYKKID